MLYRAEPNVLMIFNGDTGCTAAISGKELEIVRSWLQDEQGNGFIERLQELTVLPKIMMEEEKQQLLLIIAKTAEVCAPLRSFAAPESIHIDLTTACPLACPQCYKELSEVTLSLEKFAAIIAQAKEMKVFQIALGGGEPLLLNNLAQYIQLVRAAKMACTLTSSGYQLTAKRVEELRGAGINHIQISLNGSTEEIHACSRDGYQEAIRALTVLAQSKVPFGINWVARSDNAADFTNIVSLAKELQADHLNILRYKPAFREEYGKIRLSDTEFYDLAAKIKQVQGVKLKIDSAFSPLLCHLYGTNLDTFNCGCGAGRRFMVIDAHGQYKPCSHMNIANQTNDIAEYWGNSPELHQLRQVEEILDGKCQSCQWLYCCRGCRAICEKIYLSSSAGERDCPVYMARG